MTSIPLKHALLQEIIRQWSLALLLFLAFFSGLFLQHVRYTIRDTTKRTGELRTKLETLEIEASHLLLEEEFLRSTGRLKAVAEQELGMCFSSFEPKQIALPYFTLEE